jgi:transcriptional regulator with XRE-family HTH domain
MDITGRQIRAARGLLGWSMEELARKARLTNVTIRNIETDEVQPQEKTLAAILTLFDRQGIEFLDDEGVRVRKQQSRSYAGKAGYRQLLDHIYETLKDGGRIRQFNFGDLRYLPYADEFVAEHLERMASIQDLDARILALKNEVNLPVSYCDYRVLLGTYEHMAPWYLYEDFLVLPLFESGAKKEFVTIHSKLLAERYAREFDVFWELSSDLPKKRARA